MSANKTLAVRQKKTVIAIACAIILLIAALITVNYLVSIFQFTDVDGTLYTLKREGGAYALFDENGYMLDTVIEEGKEYFVTDLGTMVSVTAGGKASIYAAVDTDDGEAVSEYNRLLVFPRVESSALKTLRVSNEHGSYTFERKNEKVVLSGFETVSYDQNSYAYLASLCGSMVVMDNGRFSAKTVEKYGLAEYGLDKPKATFTVTSTAGKVYTVHIGNPIVSGNGYYAQFAGRDVVYIVNGYYSMLFEPIESYITPLLTYGVTTNNYPEVQNFRVYDYSYGEDGTPEASLVTALTYWPYEERENTEYQTQSYKMIDEELLAYVPESIAVTSTMEKLASLENAVVVKLGVTDKALTDRGLDKPQKLLSYDFTVTENGKTYQLRNRFWFSAMTERGTYYVYPEVEISEDGMLFLPLGALDFILEVSPASLPFMTWDKIDWVEEYYFHINIMLMEQMEIDTPEGKITFAFTVGKDDVEKIAATMNGETRNINIRQYKELYRHMLYGVLFDEAWKTREELDALAANKDKWQLSFRVKTKSTDKTDGIDNTYSFYKLGDSESYLTINGGGDFYVLTTSVNTIIDYTMKLWRGENVQ